MTDIEYIDGRYRGMHMTDLDIYGRWTSFERTTKGCLSYRTTVFAPSFAYLRYFFFLECGLYTYRFRSVLRTSSVY
jgi:hypothetical protein